MKRIAKPELGTSRVSLYVSEMLLYLAYLKGSLVTCPWLMGYAACVALCCPLVVIWRHCHQGM